ncbi:dioxygenase [Streptomyces sp. BH104]|uniref:dioxygenase family protein n=1 Tax=Streptomyces sp. BH104 TaxID=3410407 RepID=UPI003BB4ED49
MSTDEYDLTELAAERWSTAESPRLAELMTSLVRHLHAYAREVNLTEEEWAAAITWLTAAGRLSDDKRQELVLASDVLGLSMLTVELGHRFSERATPATVLGPFHIDGSPEVPYAHDMSDGLPGTPLFLTGTVTDTAGTPLPHVVLDVWQADTDGAYESQVPGVDEARLRAKYTTREDGTYCIRTVAPLGYAIPMDGPVGELIHRTRISHFRPAHVHFLIDHPGHRRLITHLFREGGQYLDSDVVFGTKDPLIVPFTERDPAAAPPPDSSKLTEPYLQAEYTFVLEPE